MLGFSYDLYFENEVGDMDEQFESNGVKLYVDPLSFQYLENTEIDYIEDIHHSEPQVQQPEHHRQLRVRFEREVLSPRAGRHRIGRS